MKKIYTDQDPRGDWTKLATFTHAPLPQGTQCKGCKKLLGKGSVRLHRVDPHYNKTTTLRAVCNEDCLQTYDDKVWRALARKNQGGKFQPVPILDFTGVLWKSSWAR